MQYIHSLRHAGNVSRQSERGFELDPRGLAALRIGLGLVLLLDLALRLPDLEAFYSDVGAVPRDLVWAEKAPPWQFALFFGGGSVAWGAAFFMVFAGAATALLLGWRTRVASVICFVLWTSLMARNPFVLNFGDRIFRVVLFFCMFLPLGARLSLDARRRGPGAPLSVPYWAGIAYQVQLVVVYGIGVVHKNHPIWTTGEAVSFTLHFDALTRPLGAWLGQFPLVNEWLTYATLVFEVVLAFLVFSPWQTARTRTLAVLAAAGFHLGLAATLRLGTFPLVCLVAWLPLLPVVFWQKAWGEPESERSLFEKRRPSESLCNVLALGSLALVLAYNAATLRAADVPTWLHEPARQLALNQRWTMFAPYPTRHDGWYVVTGVRKDGSHVDAWSGEGRPSYAKPADPGLRYRDYHWLIYMLQVYMHRDDSRRGEYLADWMCRRHRREHPDAPLVSISLDYMLEMTLPGGRDGAPERVPVVRRRCEKVVRPRPLEEEELSPHSPA